MCVLLAQRMSDGSCKAKLYLPGRKVEGGELPHEARLGFQELYVRSHSGPLALLIYSIVYYHKQIVQVFCLYVED